MTRDLIILFVIIAAFIVMLSLTSCEKNAAFFGNAVKWVAGMGLIAFVIYQIDAYSKNP